MNLYVANETQVLTKETHTLLQKPAVFCERLVIFQNAPFILHETYIHTRKRPIYISETRPINLRKRPINLRKRPTVLARVAHLSYISFQRKRQLYIHTKATPLFKSKETCNHIQKRHVFSHQKKPIFPHERDVSSHIKRNLSLYSHTKETYLST